MACKIYLLTNVINNKVYVGQTWRSLKRRMGPQGIGYKNNLYLYNSIQKYGVNNFKYSILYECNDQEEANKLEFDYIKKYNSRNRKIGYNLKEGGKNGKHSQKAKDKVSAANFGKKHTKEARQKISKNNARYWLGKKRSQNLILASLKFSADEREKISKEYVAGETVKGLARKYSCSETAIKNSLRIANIKPRPAGIIFSLEEEKKIIELYVIKQFSLNMLGKLYKCHNGKIRIVLSKYSIRLHKNVDKITEEIQKEIIDKYNNGVTVTDLIKQYKRTLYTIKDIINNIY